MYQCNVISNTTTITTTTITTTTITSTISTILL